MARALATSATVLAVVDLTMVYLPALGTERGLTAATVGAMLTVRAVFSMLSRLLLGRVSRAMGRMRPPTVSLVLSTVALAAAGGPHAVWLLFVVITAPAPRSGRHWGAAHHVRGHPACSAAARGWPGQGGQALPRWVIGPVAAGTVRGWLERSSSSAVVVGGTLVLLRGVTLD